MATELFNPLDQDDRQKLVQLLIKSRLARTNTKRETLCNKIRVTHQKLDFLQNVAEEDFAVLFVEHLHDISHSEAIKGLLDCLSEELKGENLKQLQELQKKFQPHELQPDHDRKEFHLSSSHLAICYSDDQHEIVEERVSPILSAHSMKLQPLERDYFLEFKFPAIFILAPEWLIDQWKNIEIAFTKAAPDRFEVLLNPELDPAISLTMIDVSQLNDTIQTSDLINELISAFIFPYPNSTLLACLQEQLKMNYNLPAQPSGTNIIALMYLSQQASETHEFSMLVLTRYEQLSTINISAPKYIGDLKSFLALLQEHISEVLQTFDQVLDAVPEHHMGLTTQKAIEKTINDINKVESTLLKANKNRSKKAPQDLQAALLSLSHSLGHLRRQLCDLLKQSSAIVFVLDQ